MLLLYTQLEILDEKFSLQTTCFSEVPKLLPILVKHCDLFHVHNCSELLL